MYSYCYDGYIHTSTIPTQCIPIVMMVISHTSTIPTQCIPIVMMVISHTSTISTQCIPIYPPYIKGSKYEPMWKANIYSSFYLSGIQCYNMGHNSHGINLYGILIIPMGNLHAGGHSERRTLSPSTMCTSYILATRLNAKLTLGMRKTPHNVNVNPCMCLSTK